MLGIYRANRIDNGNEVEGNLIYQEDSPVAYILTKENFNRSVTDELDNGKTKCNLIRVMKKSIKQLN